MGKTESFKSQKKKKKTILAVALPCYHSRIQACHNKCNHKSMAGDSEPISFTRKHFQTINRG